AGRPARGLQPGPHRSLVGPADAEVGDGLDARRDPEQLAQVVGAVEADPADAQSLGASRQPQVLHRARRAVDVGLGDRAAAAHLDARVAWVAAHAHAERRLDDALDLLVEELARALGEAVRLAQPLAPPEAADRHARAELADDDKPPRLHQPDRRRAVRRLEHALEHLPRHLAGPEAADVAPLRH